jgi:hypothetical protein
MIRTAFAIVAAALIFAAVTGTSRAAPIAPLTGVSAAETGSLTQVRWYHHRHCWRGRWGHLHCRW